MKTKDITEDPHYKRVYNEKLKRDVLMVQEPSGEWVVSAGERMNDFGLMEAAKPVKS